MTEYWISKKQYWCKYCSIWIRDDAPSRRQHETGLRHIGAKERFIRDLYKSGSMAKRDKEQEAQEMARIEAAAEAAHAQDTGTAGPSRKSVLYAQNHKGPSSAVSRPSKSGDKFANYSTASQLGLVDDETPQPTTFEIEQMLKNKETKVGQWESVVAEPTGLDSASIGYRPGNGRAEHGADGEKETEGWKFQHKGKRPVRDPYDDDDFDPSTILKMRKKVKQDQDAVEPSPPVVILSQEELAMKEGALDREGWSGKIELTPATASNGEKKDGEGLVYQSGGGWVKLENSSGGTFVVDAPIPGLGPGLGDEAVGTGQVDKKDVLDNVDSKSNLEEDVKPTVPEDREAEAAPVSAGGTETATGGLFKKRRPPPSSRKK